MNEWMRANTHLGKIVSVVLQPSSQLGGFLASLYEFFGRGGFDGTHKPLWCIVVRRAFRRGWVEGQSHRGEGPGPLVLALVLPYHLHLLFSLLFRLQILPPISVLIAFSFWVWLNVVELCGILFRPHVFSSFQIECPFLTFLLPTSKIPTYLQISHQLDRLPSYLQNSFLCKPYPLKCIPLKSIPLKSLPPNFLHRSHGVTWCMFPTSKSLLRTPQMHTSKKSLPPTSYVEVMVSLFAFRTP